MSGQVKLSLPSGGSKTLSAPDSASDEVVTLPAGTKTLADTGTTDALDTRVNAVGGRKNLIINGAMQVAQRGTSVTGTSSPQYLVDRFTTTNTGLSGTYNITQETDGPSGFNNSLKIECANASSLDAGDYLGLSYNTEAQDLHNIGWGTSRAKSLTLSFWVKGNVTGQYVAWLYRYSSSTRHCAQPYTINQADTWEHKTVTFPADLSGGGIVGSATSTGTILRFMHVAGSSWASGTAPTSWTNAISADRWVDQQVDLMASVGNYWQITGVQLELGSVATDFEHRSYGEELALCQRYYNTSGIVLATGSPDRYYNQTHLQVEMRVQPTISVGSIDSGSGGTLAPNWDTNGTQTSKKSFYQGTSNSSISNSWHKFDAEL